MFRGLVGVTKTIRFPMVKVSSTDLAVSADWPPAASDTKVKTGGAAAANSTNLVVGTTGETEWKLVLTAAEMKAMTVTVAIVDAATKVVQDTLMVIENVMPTYINGTAQALSTTGLTVPTAYRPPNDDALIGWTATVIGGHGWGASAVVTAYTGSTGVCVITPAWTQALTTDSVIAWTGP